MSNKDITITLPKPYSLSTYGLPICNTYSENNVTYYEIVDGWWIYRFIGKAISRLEDFGGSDYSLLKIFRI